MKRLVMGTLLLTGCGSLPAGVSPTTGKDVGNEFQHARETTQTNYEYAEEGMYDAYKRGETYAWEHGAKEIKNGDLDDQGETGAPGSAGPTGDTGPQGLPGADGATGPLGPSGADGATGPAGSDGADGADGAPGADGTDGEACEIEKRLVAHYGHVCKYRYFMVCENSELEIKTEVTGCD